MKTMASISTCFTLSPNSHFYPSSALLRAPNYFSRTRPYSHPESLPRLSFKLREPRVSSPVVRASIDMATGIGRPGGVVESDKLPSDVRKRTMEAVDACGGRVTIGDVASRAGLKLDQAQRALQALAADTNGFLEVSDEGDVLYVFPKNYRTSLAAKSFRIKLEPWLDKAKAAAEYLVRVSFGTALIASIVLVYTTIIAIISSRSEEDNRGRRGGRSYDSGFSLYFSPTDLFWYWDPYYYRRRRVQADNGRMNFIESVFSFVFGDGDPNQGIEEERWKLIGQYIASNGGVVAAEELAPYLDVDKAKDMYREYVSQIEGSHGGLVHGFSFKLGWAVVGEPKPTIAPAVCCLVACKSEESYILPVLLRFDGQPEIDEEGNILYRFPSLQRTASPQRTGRKEYVGKRWADWVGGIDKFFKERKWQFSKTGASERAMVIGLGGLNLFGVIILGTMLKDSSVLPSGFIKFVADIFPLLQIYAGSFFAIPLIRWFLFSKRNAEIERRNRTRLQCAQALEVPDISLRRKLLSARDMAQRTVIGQDRIVYSTEKDLFEQDYEARDWERRFREIDKSD